MRLQVSYAGLPAGQFLKEDRPGWAIWSERSRPEDRVSLTALEDEIRELRVQMEQAFLTEQALTAELVVSLSTRLDEKINLYMRLTRKNE
ncbi:Spo0E family sporulation regulatory protein-aspartic acid phosphatase [Paenibacillus thermoaerophilus]|uniref:Spo0E family sporulation regulatory protein-aspartic acid phosphatase n=1 Tax=Paenibacillus thermoaerophilus TaxID=1215385 RepID=A0ABW2UWR3_9BACL|nr:aspartyl-phosphate phosphatase Spo0E family protein [Paenibacillus thermoaerophilus]TMV15892.1 aspartyl-phosphate phosphatase Spo0E family protein [Paenibacillus thermoaerophilus]